MDRTAPTTRRGSGRKKSITSARPEVAFETDVLSTVSWRETRQRRIASQAIAQKPTPFTAESLARELRERGVSRSSVYRILDRLRQLRIVERVRIGHADAYVVCGESRHHHHFTCTGCGQMYLLASRTIESEIQRIAATQRFQLRMHCLEISGVCRGCRASN